MSWAVFDRAARPGSDAEVSRLRRRNADLEALSGTVGDVTATLAFHEVIDRLLARTLSNLDSEGGSILLRRPGGALHIAHARGLDPGLVKRTRIPIGAGIAGWVAATGRSLFCEDIESDARFARPNRAHYLTKSFLSAPLLLGGGPPGVINVHDKRTRQSYLPDDLELLEAIGRHAAIALRNARRYERVLLRARHDALTGLANPAEFETRLSNEIRRAYRYRRPLGLLLLEVEGLESLSERRGRFEAEKALVRIAGLIGVGSRSHDFAAHLDETSFAILLPEAGEEGSSRFARRIRAAIDAHGFGPDASDALTTRIAPAQFPRDGFSGDELMRCAQAGLYRTRSRDFGSR